MDKYESFKFRLRDGRGYIGYIVDTTKPTTVDDGVFTPLRPDPLYDTGYFHAQVVYTTSPLLTESELDRELAREIERLRYRDTVPFEKEMIDMVVRGNLRDAGMLTEDEEFAAAEARIESERQAEIARIAAETNTIPVSDTDTATLLRLGCTIETYTDDGGYGAGHDEAPHYSTEQIWQYRGDDIYRRADLRTAFVPMPDPLNETITKQEIASAYGIHRQTVQDAIDSGAIPARQSGKTWLIRRADAEKRWGRTQN